MGPVDVAPEHGKVVGMAAPYLVWLWFNDMHHYRHKSGAGFAATSADAMLYETLAEARSVARSPVEPALVRVVSHRTPAVLTWSSPQHGRLYLAPDDEATRSLGDALLFPDLAAAERVWLEKGAAGFYTQVLPVRARPEPAFGEWS